MTISTDAPGTKPAVEKSEPASRMPRRVRTTRWMMIVGGILAVVVFLIVGFYFLKSHLIAQFLANLKPPPPPVSVAEVKSETVPHLLTSFGSLAAVHQVDVSADVSGRITKIMFIAGAAVKKGDPLLQIFDDPDQADLASFKAQTLNAKLALDRAQALLAKSFGPQATVDQAQAAYDQAKASVEKTEAVISQKLVRAPFDGVLGVRQVEVGQYLTAGAMIVTLTDLSQVYLNFTATEKDAALLSVGQTVDAVVDAYPGRKFQGKITTIEPQIATDTRNIRVQATIDNPEGLLKPGMFATTTVVLPPEAPKLVIPETAVDYTLYGDSAFVLKEEAGKDGKTALHAQRIPIQTAERINGQVVVTKGLNAGDRVVAVGQQKLQPGMEVVVSDDPPPPPPKNPPRY